MKTNLMGLLLASLLLATTASAQPPSGLPTAPAPSDPAPAATAKTTDIMLLLADTHFYKQDAKKKAGFDVNLTKAPYEWQVAVDEKVQGKAWLEEVRTKCEDEANRPSARGIKITKLTHLRFTLSESGDRFESVLVYLEGTKPKTGGMPMDTEPLVPAASTDSASVTLTLSEVTWTPAFSNEKAKEWRTALHTKLGRPDDGTTWRHSLAVVESKIVIRPKPKD
jgi:hypothetical protein